MSRVRPKSAGRVRSSGAGLPSPAEQLARYGSGGASFVEQLQSPCSAATPTASLRQPHLAAAAEQEPPFPVSPAASVSGCSGTSFAPPLHAPRGERPPRPCSPAAPAVEGWPQTDSRTPTAEGCGGGGAGGVGEAAPSNLLNVPPPLPPPPRRAQSEQVAAPDPPAGPRALQRAQSETPQASAPLSHRGRIGAAAAGGPRRRGAAASAAGAQAKRAAAAKARNPFIEYDVREKRLMRERKWLQEDSTYLSGRKEELRYSTLMKKHNIECESKQDLYEKRTYYGPYSVKLKSQKQRASSAGRQRPASAPTGEDRCSHALSVKKMAQELKNSSSDDFQKSFIRSLSGREKDFFIQRLSQWEIDLLRSRGISLDDTPREKAEPLQAQDFRALFARSSAPS